MNKDKENTIQNLYVMGEVDSKLTRECLEIINSTIWKPGDILNIYICSVGGDIFDCFAVIDIVESIKNLGVQVLTHGLGQVVSAGFFIFLLGDIRVLYPNCGVYVHEHITIPDKEQTYSERIKADKTEEVTIYEMYISYVSRRLGISHRRTKSLLRKNKWLTIEEINKFNIPKIPDAKEVYNRQPDTDSE